MNGWPNGFYRPAEWWPFRIVAVPHLPETPDTLALRLMGRGEILKQAVEELDVRRHDGFHWKEVARRMIDAHRSGPAAADPDWEEMNMHTQKLMKDIEADAHEAGREEGLEAGLEAGREEGLLPFLVLLSERLGRSLTDAEEQTMRSRLRERGGVVLWTSIKDFDRAALEVWLQPSSL